MKKYFLILMLFLTTGCETTPIDEINIFSGRWSFLFRDNSGTILRQGTVTLQDDGNICSKIRINSTGDSVYFRGSVSADGILTGSFADTCGTGTTGSVSGNLTEILGIFTGTGGWNDTAQTQNAIGLWEANRN